MKPSIKSRTIAAILFLSVAACSKGDYNTSDFTQITSRDNNGVPMGENDPTDWRMTESWTGQEQKLFANYKDYKHGQPQTGSGLSILGYPNPTTNFLAGTIPGMDLSMTLNIRLVDKNYKILRQEDGYEDDVFMISLNEYKPQNTHLRLYYMIIRNDSCIAKGHGDIRLD